MRKLSEFQRERDARRFVDHLLVAEIDSQIRGEDPFEVWVLDDRTMDAARRELRRFEAGAAVDVDAAAAIRKQRAREVEGVSQRVRDVARGWSEGETGSFGPVTMFLILASLLVAYFGDWDAPLQNQTIQDLSIEPWLSDRFLGSVRDGEVWRLLSPMLIHFGLVHLAFNMLWLHQLGREIERRHGSLALIGLVVLAQLPGSLGQYLASGPSFGGMSGVVYGLFGFVWMQARYDRRRHYRLQPEATVLMMIWFVLCLTGLVGPIANVGHAAGLIVGLAAGSPAYVRDLRQRATSSEFTEGSWASENLRGGKRIVRRYFSPYVPLWFLLVALFGIALEFMP